MKKNKPLSPTRFRFACKVKSRSGLEREVVVENDDPNAALLQLASEAARAGSAGSAVVEAHVTIFATRKFISTFKPLEDEA
jgi:hypothetical protein